MTKTLKWAHVKIKNWWINTDNNWWFLTPPLRPAAIGGAGPPLPHLQGDAVGADAGRKPGPHPPAEGDPGRQSGHDHHRRQRLHLVPHPQEGQAVTWPAELHQINTETLLFLHFLSVHWWFTGAKTTEREQEDPSVPTFCILQHHICRLLRLSASHLHVFLMNFESSDFLCVQTHSEFPAGGAWNKRKSGN